MLDEDFHVHVYFTEDTRASAMRIREHLGDNEAFEVDLQPVRDQPMGPHPTPMFNAHLDRANFGRAMHWLMLNHGPHAVLVHPNTPDPVKDHTHHALWLGGPLDLRLDHL
jgi:aromatic ring-cleaving dioxygenase